MKEHSLFHKVFKSKYFQYGSLLNTEVGTNPSWAYRSLLEGTKVIEKCAKWKIGNGESIPITAYPWALINYPFRITDEGCYNPNLTLVRQLINGSSNWNEDLIRNSFDNQVTEAIL